MFPASVDSLVLKVSRQMRRNAKAEASQTHDGQPRAAGVVDPAPPGGDWFGPSVERGH